MTVPAPPSSAIRDPLRTDDLLSNLGHRTASNTVITTAAQTVRFATSMASTLVLARLLTPKDFGLVAMVTTFTGFLEVLKDAGLSTATVQRQVITQAQVSNLFWANLGIGFVITCLVAAFSPALAWFYHEPRLVSVAIVLSLTFLLTASAVQHQSILRRQMRFAAVALIQVVSTLLGFGVAVAMAAGSWGYWSLVGSLLTTAFCNSIITWLVSDWRPGLPKRRVGTFALFGFGAHLTGAAVVQTIMGTADTLLIGRFYGPDAVGLYSRGAALLLNPLQQFISPFYAVLVPTLSRIQNDPVRYRRVFLQVLQLLALCALPMAGFLLASAEPLVLLLLGGKWVATVPIFAAFSIVAIYTPLAQASTWLFTSQGRGQELLTSSIVTSAITLISIIAGIPFGPVGVAIGFSLSGLLIRLPVLFYFAGRSGPVRTRDLWHCLLGNMPLGFWVFSIAFAVRWFLWSHSPLVQLSVMVPVCATGIALYVVVSPTHRQIVGDAVGRFRSMVASRFQRTSSHSSTKPPEHV